MFRRLAAVTLALVGASALVTAAPANADATTDIFVDQTTSCRAVGPGIRDQPFCSVQAAADVAAPGQTVYVGLGSYDPVTITRSGTPDAPFTFRG